MDSFKKYFPILILTFAFLLLISVDINGQCPMCRMSAESNLKEGGTAGAGLNKGILYMLSLPYLLVATLGILWYKNKRKWSDDIMDEPFSDN